ncbi:MAG: ATP-binding protein [Actinobacteria bacterium]|nr:MAG: ATP-binding protein [Actinomycetota bacterium]
MTEPAKVLLHMCNGPENVTLVREALTGLSEYGQFAGAELNDIRTAVTEACNNVVVHAYEGGEGPLEVEIGLMPGTTEVVVRDEGGGIQPRIRALEEGPLGIGLAVIQALVRSVEFRDSGGGGTEVRMRFDTQAADSAGADGAGADAARADREGDHSARRPAAPLERWGISSRELSRTIGITIAPASAGRGILPRVLSVLAARANFSTDRICDVQLLADALTARAPQSPAGDLISLTVTVGRRTLQLTLGPLAAGNARVLVEQSEVEGLGSVIEKLSDEQRVSSDSGAEHLVLRMLDRH